MKKKLIPGMFSSVSDAELITETLGMQESDANNDKRKRNESETDKSSTNISEQIE